MSVIVLDIEGTICPIAFVHQVLFPYALKRAEEEINKIRFPLDPQRSKVESYLDKFPEAYKTSASTLLSHIQDLVKRDVKAGYLKSLQGYLWESGYENGEIKAPVYNDAVEAMKRWSKCKKIYIYSSGSVHAQKLFFKHTESGDLTPLICGYFDTQNAGPKTEETSYDSISSQIKAPSNSIQFFSDSPKEIDAAAKANWMTVFTVRDGNPEFKEYNFPNEKAINFNNF